MPALQNAADDFALDFGQALAPSLVEVRQRILIQTELMQDGGVDIAQVMRVIDGSETDLVGGSRNRSAADAAAGHPHGEAGVVVVAPLAALGFRSAPELSA